MQQSPLFDNSDFEMCDFLIQNGENIQRFNSLLLSYIECSHEIYVNLVAENVDIEEPDYEKIFYLIDRSVYLNSVCKCEGKLETPLDIAERCSLERISSYLRKHGAKRYSELTDAEIQQGVAALEIST